jgi:hypothetical protein
MGATERQRLTAQAGHGQQGRDQNRHEDAMRVNDHGTKVTIRHTVVNSSESIPLVPLKSMGNAGFELVTKSGCFSVVGNQAVAELVASPLSAARCRLFPDTRLSPPVRAGDPMIRASIQPTFRFSGGPRSGPSAEPGG